MVIYALTDPRNGEIRYVGKANAPRQRWWTPETTTITLKGHRSCRICSRAYQKNWRRAKGRIRGRRSICKRGHQLTPENLIIRTRGPYQIRECYTCKLTREKNYKRERRALCQNEAA